MCTPMQRWRQQLGGKSRPAPYCRVLPSDEFNGMNRESLPASEGQFSPGHLSLGGLDTPPTTRGPAPNRMAQNDVLANDAGIFWMGTFWMTMPTWDVLTMDVGRFGWWDVLTHWDVLINSVHVNGRSLYTEDRRTVVAVGGGNVLHCTKRNGTIAVAVTVCP